MKAINIAANFNRNEVVLDNKLYAPSLAFIGFGGWALYINSSDVNIAFYAAIIQGIGSFTVTLIIQTAIKFILKYSRAVKSYAIKLLLAVLPSVILTGVIASVHAATHTQEILITVLPSLLIGSIFSCYHAINCLDKQKNLNIEGK